MFGTTSQILASKTQSSLARQLTLWYQWFGHAHHAMLINMHIHGAMEDMNLPNHTLPENPYEGCEIGKNAQKPFPKQQLSPRVEKASIFFHANVCGPMSQESFSKAKYFVLFKDDFFGFHFVYCLRQKFDVLEYFKAFCNLVVQQT